MSDAFNKFINTIPKVYNAEFNRVLSSLLKAIAKSDDDVQASIELAKEQLFIRTATGNNLDRDANSLGVQRPPGLGLQDNEFQELIPNLSLKPKSIRKAFYDTADIFWGPLFSRINVTSGNFAPFALNLGDTFSVKIDDGPVQNIKILSGDLAVNGAATALEVQKILSRIHEATVTVIRDSLTNNDFINIRTNTPGSTGAIQFLDSTMIGPSKLDFPLQRFNILNLDQRVVVYNINPNELILEIPAIIPALRRTLRGSHHFHADATLEPPVPPANGIWQGSFFYGPSGAVENVTITGQRANLLQTIVKGQVYVSVAVDDNSSFAHPTGQIIFGYGTSIQEGPVRYRGIPNSNTILLDPAYVFKFDHGVGDPINVVFQAKPYIPRRNGQDLAIYLTSPSGARQVVQNILLSLAAAGVIVKFRILLPKYKYLINNPYNPQV